MTLSSTAGGDVLPVRAENMRRGGIAEHSVTTWSPEAMDLPARAPDERPALQRQFSA